jgi:integrase
MEIAMKRRKAKARKAKVHAGRHVDRLSDRTVKAAKVPKDRTRILVPDGRGLYLQVQRSVVDPEQFTRSWVFSYERNGVRRQLGLGATHTISLARARTMAVEYREELQRGGDPWTAKQERKLESKRREAEVKRVKTFRSCVEMYLKQHSKKWSAQHGQAWKNTLEIANKVIGDMNIADVQTADVVRVLQPLWNETPETASRLRGRIESILAFAAVSEFRDPDSPNPARWQRHLDQILAPRSKVRPIEHFKAMPYAELPNFLASFRKQDSIAARAVEFAFMCCARREEVAGARWSEVNWKDRTWTIPATRMKAKREHVVPLSTSAVTLLENLPTKGSEFIFGGKRPISGQAMLRAFRGRKPSEDSPTLHGSTRSTFKTWGAEQTNFQREVIEASLAHLTSDRVEAAYLRGDFLEKRRALMQAWGDFLSGKTAGVTNIKAEREKRKALTV